MDTHRKKRGHLDLIQNLAITALTVSAVILFAATQLSSQSQESNFLGHWFSPPVSSDTAPTPQTAVLSAPVRVAVSGTYGRYGSLTLTTQSDSFVPLATRLGEALGSARSFAACTEEDFTGAVSRQSVYYDFLEPLPLPVLAELMSLPDMPAAMTAISARQLVVSVTEDGTAVQLLLWDGGSTYLCCDTAIDAGGLASDISRYELGNAYFAFDYAETNEAFQQVAARSLFLNPLPQLPVLSVSNSLTDTDAILTKLGFNPYTTSRYMESGGTEVITEGDQSIRLLPEGIVRYQGGSKAGLTIDAAEETPSPEEAVSGVGQLLNQLLGNRSGDASLYLQHVQQSGTSTVLLFGYQVDGIPVRFADGAWAAEVVLSGTCVSSLVLCFRQYTAGSESSLLLPLKQAIAIAARQGGRELFIAYTDNGGDTSAAAWLLE